MNNLHRPINYCSWGFGFRSHGIILPHYLLLVLLFAAPLYSAAESSSGFSEYSTDGTIDQPVALTVAVLFCAFFLVGIFSIFIRHCVTGSYAAENSRMYNVAAAAGRGRSQVSRRGLDPSVIDTFPIFVYSAVKDFKLGKGALGCAVCISEFEGNQTLRLLPKCSHVFHPLCIDTWLASHSTCPVCRAYLVPPPSTGEKVPTQFIDSPEEQNPRPALSEVQDHVSINVQEDRRRDSQWISEDVLNTNPTPKQNGQQVVEKFPRSHSTGHSVVQAGESSEMYTLRLPDAMRKESESQKKKGTAGASSVRDGSCRKGYRNDWEESGWVRQWSDRVGRSDRWVSFLSRAGGTTSKVGCESSHGDVAVAEMKVKTTPDCLARTDDLPV